MSGGPELHAPRLAAAILGWCAGPPRREAILGDLEEEFRCGHVTQEEARRWYWSQTLRSAAPLLSQRWASAMARPLVAALTGCGAALASAALFGTLLEALLGSSRADAGLTLVSLVVASCALVSATCAGWACAWIAGRSSPGMMFAVGLFIVVPDVVRVTMLAERPALEPALAATIAAAVGLMLGTSLWHRLASTVASRPTPRHPPGGPL